MVIDFTNKVVLVTGGAGGIGRACVKALLESNAKVAIIDVSDKLLEEAAKDLNDLGKLKCYKSDITNLEEFEQVIETVRKDLGEIEILIQTAGLLRGKKALEITSTDWDQMLNINTKGMFFVMQQVVNQSMKNNGGAIVNFSSMAGIRGMRPSMASAHYSASKGAIVAMSMQAATEWAEYGIRCNIVAPGGVLTKAMSEIEISDNSMEIIPLRKLSKPEDIANSVLFLVSDKAAMITGQTLIIDGGSSVVGY